MSDSFAETTSSTASVSSTCGTGESATFPARIRSGNVLSRVTGGQLSTIDGLISTRAATPNMPNANFFLLNPAGVTVRP
jgi:filamentous hemagglutinin family protein